MNDYEVYKSDMCQIPLSGECIIRNAVNFFGNYMGENYKLNRSKIYGSFLVISFKENPDIRRIFISNDIDEDELKTSFKFKDKKITKHKMKTVSPIYRLYFKDYIDLLRSKAFYFDGHLYDVKLTAEKLLFEILSSPDRPQTNLWLEPKIDMVLEEIKNYIISEIDKKGLLPIADYEKTDFYSYNFLEGHQKKIK